MLQKFLASSGLTARLHPVPIGSISTRSLNASQVSGLSRKVAVAASRPSGPRILDLGPDGRDAATATLRDNPDTWLAFSDLVLIDPIGTGWSRAVKPDDAKNFWSIRNDADSFAKAIALYVAKNNRAASPKVS